MACRALSRGGLGKETAVNEVRESVKDIGGQTQHPVKCSCKEIPGRRPLIIGVVIRRVRIAGPVRRVHVGVSRRLRSRGRILGRPRIRICTLNRRGRNSRYSRRMRGNLTILGRRNRRHCKNQQRCANEALESHDAFSPDIFVQETLRTPPPLFQLFFPPDPLFFSNAQRVTLEPIILIGNPSAICPPGKKS